MTNVKIDPSLPLYNLDAERAVLSACLSHPPNIDVLELLQAKHFYSDANAIIYAAIVDLTRGGAAVTAPTVYAWLSARHGGVARVGGADYFGQLVARSMPADSIGVLAVIIRQLAAQRVAASAPMQSTADVAVPRSATERALPPVTDLEDPKLLAERLYPSGTEAARTPAVVACFEGIRERDRQYLALRSPPQGHVGQASAISELERRDRPVMTLDDFLAGPEALPGLRGACVMVARALSERRPAVDVAGAMFAFAGALVPEVQARAGTTTPAMDVVEAMVSVFRAASPMTRERMREDLRRPSVVRSLFDPQTLEDDVGRALLEDAGPEVCRAFAAALGFDEVPSTEPAVVVSEAVVNKERSLLPPIEGELLGDYRSRAGLPGKATAAARRLRFTGGSWMPAAGTNGFEGLLHEASREAIAQELSRRAASDTGDAKRALILAASVLRDVVGVASVAEGELGRVGAGLSLLAGIEVYARRVPTIQAERFACLVLADVEGWDAFAATFAEAAVALGRPDLELATSVQIVDRVPLSRVVDVEGLVDAFFLVVDVDRPEGEEVSLLRRIVEHWTPEERSTANAWAKATRRTPGQQPCPKHVTFILDPSTSRKTSQLVLRRALSRIEGRWSVCEKVNTGIDETLTRIVKMVIDETLARIAKMVGVVVPPATALRLLDLEVGDHVTLTDGLARAAQSCVVRRVV